MILLVIGYLFFWPFCNKTLKIYLFISMNSVYFKITNRDIIS